MISKTFLRNSLIGVLIFTIVIAGIHTLLLSQFLPVEYIQAKPWRIYAFLVPLTLLAISFIIIRFKNDHTSVINTFMGYLVIKMLGSIIFLGILMFYFKEPARPIVYQFLRFFFLFYLWKPACLFEC